MHQRGIEPLAVRPIIFLTIVDLPKVPVAKSVGFEEGSWPELDCMRRPLSIRRTPARHDRPLCRTETFACKERNATGAPLRHFIIFEIPVSDRALDGWEAGARFEPGDPDTPADQPRRARRAVP